MKRAIAGKRGSVRGAPPTVMVPFSDFSGDNPEPWRQGILFFATLGKAILFSVIVIFCLVVWYAFQQPGE